MFIAHIGAMDCFALALRRLVPLYTEKTISKLVKTRYSSYESGIGAKIQSGKVTFKELESYILASGEKQEPTITSGQQEHYESIYNNYLHG